MRRYKNALYFTDDFLRKIEERKQIKLWDGINLLFLQDTNQKQFSVTLKLLKNLIKEEKMLNTEVLKLFDTDTERFLLVGKILPKLKKFGLVESDANNGSKKYNLRFSKKFGELILDIGREIDKDALIK